MTTGRRKRISTDDLSREVARLLDRDPDLSRTAITAELRASGTAVGSERIRGVVRVARGRRGGASSITSAFNAATGVRSPVQTLLAGGATTRDGTSASKSTFAAIDWRVNYEVNVYRSGQLQRRVSNTITGRTVQDLRRFNRDLIETQIKNQIQGRLYTMFESPGDSDLYDYEFLRFDVELDKVELRGGGGRNATAGRGRAPRPRPRQRTRR